MGNQLCPGRNVINEPSSSKIDLLTADELDIDPFEFGNIYFIEFETKIGRIGIAEQEEYNNLYERMMKIFQQYYTINDINLFCTGIKLLNKEIYTIITDNSAKTDFVILIQNLEKIKYKLIGELLSDKLGLDNLKQNVILKIIELENISNQVKLLTELIQKIYSGYDLDLESNIEILDLVSDLLVNKITTNPDKDESNELINLHCDINTLVCENICHQIDSIGIYIEDLLKIGKMKLALKLFNDTHKYGRCNHECKCVLNLKQIKKYDIIVKHYNKLDLDSNVMFVKIVSLGEFIAANNKCISREKVLKIADLIKYNRMKTIFVGKVLGLTGDDSIYNEFSLVKYSHSPLRAD